MSHEAVDHINSVIEQGRATAGRVVAFYSCDPHMAPWEWFVSLVPLLRKKGFFVLALATYALPESMRGLLPCFIIPPGCGALTALSAWTRMPVVFRRAAAFLP